VCVCLSVCVCLLVCVCACTLHWKMLSLRWCECVCVRCISRVTYRPVGGQERRVQVCGVLPMASGVGPPSRSAGPRENNERSRGSSRHRAALPGRGSRIRRPRLPLRGLSAENIVPASSSFRLSIFVSVLKKKINKLSQTEKT